MNAVIIPPAEQRQEYLAIFRSIQQEARLEGMREAAEICQKTEVACRSTGQMHVHAEVGCDKCREAILAAIKQNERTNTSFLS